MYKDVTKLKEDKNCHKWVFMLRCLLALTWLIDTECNVGCTLELTAMQLNVVDAGCFMLVLSTALVLLSDNNNWQGHHG